FRRVLFRSHLKATPLRAPWSSPDAVPVHRRGARAADLTAPPVVRGAVLDGNRLATDPGCATAHRFAGFRDTHRGRYCSSGGGNNPRPRMSPGIRTHRARR